jgi:hypothetical protein|nr:MAG TPA: hypothetical protein [Caudoviricetes sp.]
MENITYARGRVVELGEVVKECNTMLYAIKRDITRELNTEFDTDKIRVLLNKADLYEEELKKANLDLSVIKKQWGLK